MVITSEVEWKNFGIKAYLTMRDNLKKWIAEGRQFKVDDEYLPQTVVGGL